MSLTRMYKMKTLYFLILFFAFNSVAQQNEMEIQTPVRWTRIAIKDLNSTLLESPVGQLKDSSKYLYSCMQMLANSDTMFFFLEGGDITEKQKLYFESANVGKPDSAIAHNQWTYLEETKEKNFIISTAPDWNPFFLEDGFPYIRINPDGTEEFCYPPRTYFQIITSDVTEIRVREEGKYNSKTKKIEYVPVAIQIYPDWGYQGDSLLYFDLKRVKERYSAPDQLPWLEDINKALPKGQQFMQTTVRKISN